MGGHRIMIVALMLLSWATSTAATVDCTTVTELISACSTFITCGSPDPYPGSPCCDAVTNLNLIADSTDNRRSVCGCLMVLITTYNPNSTAIATLPGFCGVPLGFKIDPLPLVYRADWATHLHHLQLVFEVLEKHKLYVKLSKCEFGATKVEYLGHIISCGGVSMDVKKLESVVGWPTPKSVKELRGFLGLTGYYRRFIRGYGTIARPLTELLKKNNFQWSSNAQSAFEQLKHAMHSMNENYRGCKVAL